MVRLRLACALVVLGSAGCAAAAEKGGASPSPGWVSSPQTVAGSPAGPAPSRAAVGTTATRPVRDILFLRTTPGLRAPALLRVSLAGDAVDRMLPEGVIDRERALLYAAHAHERGTRVEAIDVTTGIPLRGWSVEGRFRLPAIATNAPPVGLSADGSTLVLAEGPAGVPPGTHGDPGRLRSRFAILKTGGEGGPRLVELAGNFSFDALSPDGSVLYLVEHLPVMKPTDYQVRAYDVAMGTLRSGVIVDKRAGQLLMQGEPLAQVSSPDGGWVYTLYLNRRQGPFVHALHALNGSARCVFLPREWTAEGEGTLDWALALAPARDRLYAANGSLGVVAEISASSPAVLRTARLHGEGRTVVTHANRRSSAPDAAAPSTGAAVTRDGQTLFLRAPSGIAEVDAAPLARSRSALGAEYHVAGNRERRQAVRHSVRRPAGGR